MLNMSGAFSGKSLVYNAGRFRFTRSVDKLVGNPPPPFRPGGDALANRLPSRLEGGDFHLFLQ
jgi:hypothetical protein